MAEPPLTPEAAARMQSNRAAAVRLSGRGGRVKCRCRGGGKVNEWGKGGIVEKCNEQTVKSEELYRGCPPDTS